MRILKVICLLFCLWHKTVPAETVLSSRYAIPAESDSLSFSLPAHSEFSPVNFKQLAGNSFSLDLGPSIIRLKTFYFEKSDENTPGDGSVDGSKLRRYLSLFATSSYFGGNILAEGELAYGALGLSQTIGDQPIMFRFGLKSQWNGISYGAYYRSAGTGFFSLSGERIDSDRDEAEVWAERSFGSLRVRGTVGELWNRGPGTSEFTLTKKAATSFNFSRSNWSAVLSSSYSLADQGTASDAKTAAVANDLAIFYRPTTMLTIVPKLGVTEEWDQEIGSRTNMPSAEVRLLWNHSRDLQLTGLASYARATSEDRLRESSTLNTGAGLNWKIGSSRIGEQFLSFRLEYNHKVDFHSPSDSSPQLSAMFSFRIVGF